MWNKTWKNKKKKIEIKNALTKESENAVIAYSKKSPEVLSIHMYKIWISDIQGLDQDYDPQTAVFTSLRREHKASHQDELWGYI